MKRCSTPKKSLIALSGALAAGAAHGAVTYTYYNQTTVAGDQTLYFDLNHDGANDFRVKFNNNNAMKPYIDNNPSISTSTSAYVLANASNMGLPLTTKGTVIDANYAGVTESIQATGYYNQDNNANTVGGWTASGDVEGYVGLELVDTSSNTHFGWAHFIYNSSKVVNGVTGAITLVDCAFEDGNSVAINAGQTAEPGLPSIAVPPVSQTNYVGGTAQFFAKAIGNPDPTYQWMAGAPGSGVYTNLSDGGNISGSTSNVLTITGLTASSGADFVLVAANSFGSVTSSVPARLTVQPLVINGISPSPAMLYSGGKGRLTVSYSSSVPLSSVQWYKNAAALSDGGNVSGSATAQLVLNPLATTDSANYSVVLANTYGSVTSRVDTLTVTAPPAPYEQEVVTMSPVLFYTLNETTDPASSNALAFDYVGGLNGLYGSETLNGNATYGIAGPRPTDGFAGFSSANSAMYVGLTPNADSSFVTVPAPNLNTNTVTFTAWINPSSTVPGWAAILSYRGIAAGSANELNFSSAGTLSYHWNDNGNTYGWDSGLVPPQGQWSFVAVTIAPTNAVAYLFNASGMASSVNTNLIANNYTHPVQAFNWPGRIGGDPVDPSFPGQIDDVAVFNRTLTGTEITNLYNVAVTGVLPPPVVNLSVTRSGSQVVVSWTPAVGTLLQAPTVTGPWTTNGAASPFTTTPSGTTFYKVRVQ